MQMRSALSLSLVTIVFAAACGSEFGSESQGAAGATSGGSGGGSAASGGGNVGGSGGTSDGGTAGVHTGGAPSGGTAGAGNTGNTGNTGGSNVGGASGQGGGGGGTVDASTGGRPAEDGGKDAAPVCLECNAFEKPTCCNCIPNECPVAYDACRCSPDCAAYIGCRVQCGGSSTCIAGCKNAYPAGMALGDQFLYCSDQAGCACN